MFSRPALRSILTPLIRLLMRRGVTYQLFSQAAKDVFVSEAHAELERSGKKVNISRLSAMTGIHRSDVARYQSGGVPAETEPTTLTKVIGLWEKDKRFISSRKKPRILSCGQGDSEFNQLVLSVHNHLHPGTILFELERCGVVRRVSDTVELLQESLPLHKDPSGALQFFTKDLETLADAIDFNITSPDEYKNLHIRTEFDNIAPESIPMIREWIREQGRAFHRKTREFLSQYDIDVSPNLSSSSAGKGRVVLTAFSLSTTPPVSDVPSEGEKDAGKI
jgi:hypothetical protein